MKFWLNALIHGTWLYNRAYHSAIEITPHQAFTGPRPTLDNLLTFGCTVTSRMARDRRSALDPNSHYSIFLGYVPNNDIRYWDIITQSEETVGHGKYNEVQYGDNPIQRSPASKHLLNIMTGADPTKRRTDGKDERATEITLKPNAVSIDTTQLVLDSVPPPFIQLTRQNSSAPAKSKLSSTNSNNLKCHSQSSRRVSMNISLFSATTRLSASLSKPTQTSNEQSL